MHASATEEIRFTPQQAALFLDVDGVLLDIAPRPEDVRLRPEIHDLLRRWFTASDGALALVSGRSIPVLDDIFGDLQLPAAGLHGFERRDAFGMYSRRVPPAPASLDRVRRHLTQIASRSPGLLVEDKRFALALHYRLAPQLEQEVIADVKSAARFVAKDFDLQRGKKVIELRPKSATKAAAVEEFMDEPPFAGRVPVYFGDDLTDEGAFRWVSSRGGISVAVDATHETVARYHLNGVSAVRECLERNLRAGGARSS